VNGGVGVLGGDFVLIPCRSGRCRKGCYLDNSALTCLFGLSVGLLARLAEVGQELPDPARDRLMAFNFAGPVAFRGVLD
jgi:hypothetical protein